MSAFVINSYAFGGEDPDAKAYLDAVETADTQALEAAVRKAVDDFVKGCKADGIWSAIKASCILAGARTLTGALTPLVGSAPTNNNFVSGDYDREDGLVGNGSTKYINSNRNNNADPQNDQHMMVYVSQAGSLFPEAYMGAGGPADAGATHFGPNSNANVFFARSRSSSAFNHSTAPASATGAIGISRASSSAYNLRVSGVTNSISNASQSPYNASVAIFWRTDGTGQSNARLSFYSIGEALDLADLDTRVSTLMTDLAAAIP
jgi:hypothetical protein